jgi:hypothetical protein
MSNANNEFIYPLTVEPDSFVGKKPTAVIFGDERIKVNTWRMVYAIILK